MPAVKRISSEAAQAAVEDYLSGQDHMTVVAKRHNMGQSTLWRYVNKNEKRKSLNPAETSNISHNPEKDAKLPIVSRTQPNPSLAKGFKYTKLGKPAQEEKTSSSRLTPWSRPDIQSQSSAAEIARLHKCIVDLVLQIQKIRQIASEAGIVLPA